MELPRKHRAPLGASPEGGGGGGGAAGVLSYITSKGMCHSEGYGLQAV